MIIYGDITDIEQGAIIHQVNCQNVMGSGVAKALYTKWPKVKERYHEHNQNLTPEHLFGRIDTVTIAPTLYIINSYSQLTYGRTGKHTDEKVLINNIKRIVKARDTFTPDLTIYVPHRIGCGLGGGDWDIVYEGIKDIRNLKIVKYGGQK